MYENILLAGKLSHHVHKIKKQVRSSEQNKLWDDNNTGDLILNLIFGVGWRTFLSLIGKGEKKNQEQPKKN